MGFIILFKNSNGKFITIIELIFEISMKTFPIYFCQNDVILHNKLTCSYLDQNSVQLLSSIGIQMDRLETDWMGRKG